MFELILSVLLLILCIIVLYHLRQGAIFVPTQNQTVTQMVQLAKIVPGSKIADLGSGDGRIVIALAKAGAQATGFEINPILVWISRWKIKKSGLVNQAKISTASFWKQNLGEYDVVTVFGITHIMKRLSDKLKRELKPNAMVISNAFRIEGLQEVEKLGSLFVYKRL